MMSSGDAPYRTYHAQQMQALSTLLEETAAYKITDWRSQAGRGILVALHTCSPVHSQIAQLRTGLAIAPAVVNMTNATSILYI